jgi:hypothetical protein
MEVSGQLHAYAAFTLGESVTGINWLGDRFSPRVDLDPIEKTLHSQESNPGGAARSYTD